MEKRFIDKGLGLWYFQIQFDRFICGEFMAIVTPYWKKRIAIIDPEMSWSSA